jgi:16S rRNA (adenine1518-N6/adenine1519-N6)-dimethyltransferase
MKLSEMRAILGAGDLRLTKSLGQNFLHDTNQLRRIVATAELTSRDAVLEIGPGLGPLTERLLAQAGRVLAIEKDARLVGLLRERLAGVPNLELTHDDALAYLRRQPGDWSQWKVVANLPYAVASPIIVELALHPRGPKRMVVTVQWEVAQRLVAGPGHPDYGVLSLLAQLHYKPRLRFKIPRACFFPEPEIESACVTLERRPEPLLAPDAALVYVACVKRAFAQRRKMMFKLLKTLWPAERLEDAFKQAGLRPQTRAEEVGLQQYVILSRHLCATTQG